MSDTADRVQKIVVEHLGVEADQVYRRAQGLSLALFESRTICGTGQARPHSGPGLLSYLRRITCVVWS
jgi:hypothetical protein